MSKTCPLASSKLHQGFSTSSSSERAPWDICSIAWSQGEWVPGWMNESLVCWEHDSEPRASSAHRTALATCLGPTDLHPTAVVRYPPFSVFCLRSSHAKPVRDKPLRSEAATVRVDLNCQRRRQLMDPLFLLHLPLLHSLLSSPHKRNKDSS